MTARHRLNELRTVYAPTHTETRSLGAFVGGLAPIAGLAVLASFYAGPVAVVVPPELSSAQPVASAPPLFQVPVKPVISVVDFSIPNSTQRPVALNFEGGSSKHRHHRPEEGQRHEFHRRVRDGHWLHSAHRAAPGWHRHVDGHHADGGAHHHHDSAGRHYRSDNHVGEHHQGAHSRGGHHAHH